MEKQETEFGHGNQKWKSESRKNVPSSYIAFLFTAATERMRIFIGGLYT